MLCRPTGKLGSRGGEVWGNPDDPEGTHDPAEAGAWACTVGGGAAAGAAGGSTTRVLHVISFIILHGAFTLLWLVEVEVLFNVYVPSRSNDSFVTSCWMVSARSTVRCPAAETIWHWQHSKVLK